MHAARRIAHGVDTSAHCSRRAPGSAENTSPAGAAGWRGKQTGARAPGGVGQALQRQPVLSAGRGAAPATDCGHALTSRVEARAARHGFAQPPAGWHAAPMQPEATGRHDEFAPMTLPPERPPRAASIEADAGATAAPEHVPSMPPAHAAAVLPLPRSGLPGMALGVLATLASLVALHLAGAVVVPLLLGLTFSYALTPLVNRMVRLRLPRMLAAGLLLTGILASFGTLAWSLSDDAASMILFSSVTQPPRRPARGSIWVRKPIFARRCSARGRTIAGVWSTAARCLE